jgi:hypothetical protein
MASTDVPEQGVVRWILRTARCRQWRRIGGRVVGTIHLAGNILPRWRQPAPIVTPKIKIDGNLCPTPFAGFRRGKYNENSKRRLGLRPVNPFGTAVRVPISRPPGSGYPLFFCHKTNLTSPY